jgi:mono/diheme cytochrome c family protein
MSRLLLIAPVALALTFVASTSLLSAQTEQKSTARQSVPALKWKPVTVTLPASTSAFTGDNGAVIANSQCLKCHSAGMILTQPRMTREQWRAEIDKMRNAYGAQLPADQVDQLAAYLSALDQGISGG